MYARRYCCTSDVFNSTNSCLTLLFLSVCTGLRWEEPLWTPYDSSHHPSFPFRDPRCSDGDDSGNHCLEAHNVATIHVLDFRSSKRIEPIRSNLRLSSTQPLLSLRGALTSLRLGLRYTLHPLPYNLFSLQRFENSYPKLLEYHAQIAAGIPLLPSESYVVA